MDFIHIAFIIKQPNLHFDIILLAFNGYFKNGLWGKLYINTQYSLYCLVKYFGPCAGLEILIDNAQDLQSFGWHKFLRAGGELLRLLQMVEWCSVSSAYRIRFLELMSTKEL